MIEDMLVGMLGGMFAGAMVFMILVIIALYVYTSWAIMTIAKKTKTENPWLAWIPIANLYLLVTCAKEPWWWFLIILLAPFVPVIGSLAALAASIFIWWKVCEQRDKPGWLSLLMLIPIVNLIIIGIVAWAD